MKPKTHQNNYFNCVKKKNGQCSYTFRREQIILCKRENHSETKHKFFETDIIKMLECFACKIFAMLGGRVYQQPVGIPLGTNCSHLHSGMYLYSPEANLMVFIHGFLVKMKRS
jgi:hypothetical protein